MMRKVDAFADFSAGDGQQDGAASVLARLDVILESHARLQRVRRLDEQELVLDDLVDHAL
jgi:hypothetical protein